MHRNNSVNNKEFLIQWVKNGDYSKTFNSGADLNKKVEYKNVTESPKVKICICGYKDGATKIIFGSKQLIDVFLKKCNEEKLVVEDDFMVRDVGSTNILVESNTKQDQKKLSLFLNCIDSIIPLGEEIKKEMFESTLTSRTPH